MMLLKKIEEIFTQAFTQAFPELEKSFSVEVTRSTHARFGHYQCNSAMKLSKALKLAPRDIANKVMTQLQNNPDIQCEVAGPGFINLTLVAVAITDFCRQMMGDDTLGLKTTHPQKIIIDFSSPNTAKEMHVGHLRSTIIGDCLARIFEYQGHEVLRLSHVGDWGTSFGMLIAYIKQYEPQLMQSGNQADLTTLVNYYKKAKQRFDEDEAFKKQSQLEVVALQGGDRQSLQVWELICDITRKAHQEIYDLLDTHLVERGESFYNPYLEGVIKDLESKHLITISDGAKCMFLDGFVNREGEPLPFILQKSDGGFNYATTDLASIRHRIEDEKGQRLIYLTDAGQATHFAMLFAAAQKAQYLDPTKVRCDHVPFGLVLGPDGKKFKTRSGNTERLIDLLTAAIDKAEIILLDKAKEKENAAVDKENVHQTAKILGINAVKYSDLACNRTHDYAFSYDKMLRFEGNTAAFLMYAYVRIQGIKRKAQNAQVGTIVLIHESEITLGLHIAQFAEILYSISDDLMPNRLCEYLYELAEKFNAFFRDCTVIGSDQQASRMALCELTASVLKQGLTILGLQTVTRM